jgi:hypothetical protein
MLPTEVFISHSDQDWQFVTNVVEVLQRHGIAAWYSRKNIVGAQQWHGEIGAALQRCDWFAIVLSPNSIKSKWVKRELVFALQEERFENKIVPWLYLPCEHKQFSWTLSLYQMVDFAGSFETGCRNLLRVWGVGDKPISLNP